MLAREASQTLIPAGLIPLLPLTFLVYVPANLPGKGHFETIVAPVLDGMQT